MLKFARKHNHLHLTDNNQIILIFSHDNFFDNIYIAGYNEVYLALIRVSCRASCRASDELHSTITDIMYNVQASQALYGPICVYIYVANVMRIGHDNDRVGKARYRLYESVFTR